MAQWMIYGANGYTGELCARLAAERGMKPILAGRRVTAIAPLADELGLEHRTFGLDDAEEAKAGLKGVSLVLHCAGPFSATSKPMLDACLAAGADYLDITGEIGVFEAIHARSPECVRRGIRAIPGVGFDVVPTDCLAAMLSRALPDAVELELAIAGLGGGVSPGTAKTAVEGAPGGGAARIDGRIKKVPAGWRTREVPLGGKDRFVVSIPWGDVSTAWYSTGIPNITTYAAFPRSAVRWMKLTEPLSPVLGSKPVQALLKGLVNARVSGPTEQQRTEGRSAVWGRATAADGRYVEGHLTTPEGYRFTALASLAAVERCLSGEVPVGALTPSRAFGADFVTGLEGVTVDPLRQGS